MTLLQEQQREFLKTADSLINNMSAWHYLDAIHEGLSSAEQLLMVVLDTQNDLNFVLVSPEWERVTGWKPSEMVGKNYKDFVHPDDLLSTLHAADEYATEGESQVGFRNRYKMKNGEYVELVWLRGLGEPSSRYSVSFALPVEYIRNLIV